MFGYVNAAWVTDSSCGISLTWVLHQHTNVLLPWAGVNNVRGLITKVTWKPINTWLFYFSKCKVLITNDPEALRTNRVIFSTFYLFDWVFFALKVKFRGLVVFVIGNHELSMFLVFFFKGKLNWIAVPLESRLMYASSAPGLIIYHL